MKKVCSLLLVMVLLLSICQSALAEFWLDVKTTESYHYNVSEWMQLVLSLNNKQKSELLMKSLGEDL